MAVRSGKFYDYKPTITGIVSQHNAHHSVLIREFTYCAVLDTGVHCSRYEGVYGTIWLCID